MAISPIPPGYQTATPYLIIKNAASAIEFYQQALGATESMRLADHNGKIAHAEIRIGNSVIMLADEFPDMGFLSPESLGGTPVTIMLYVEDVDTQFSQAIAVGATELRPIENQFFGDRSGKLADPFGHNWIMATHIEDVSPAEINRRFSNYLQQQSES